MLDRLATVEYGTKIVFSEREDTDNAVRRKVTLPNGKIFCHKYDAPRCKCFTWLEMWWNNIVREFPDVQTLISSLVFLHQRPLTVLREFPVLCHDVSSDWKQLIVGGRAYLVLSLMPSPMYSFDIVIFDVGDVPDICEQAAYFFSTVEPGRICLGYYNDELVVVSTPDLLDTHIARDAIGISLGGRVYLYGDIIIDLNINESVCCVSKGIIDKPVVFTSSQDILERARETVIRHWDYLNL